MSLDRATLCNRAASLAGEEEEEKPTATHRKRRAQEQFRPPPPISLHLSMKKDETAPRKKGGLKVCSSSIKWTGRKPEASEKEEKSRCVVVCRV